MKLWKCICGKTTTDVDEAMRHTSKNDHVMNLVEVPDNSRYSVKVISP